MRNRASLEFAARTVFDRIEVDVIEMPGKIGVVAQRVLPISSLPNSALAFAGAAGRDPLVLGNHAKRRF
jgi:hypothetical protein